MFAQFHRKQLCITLQCVRIMTYPTPDETPLSCVEFSKLS